MRTRTRLFTKTPSRTRTQTTKGHKIPRGLQAKNLLASLKTNISGAKEAEGLKLELPNDKVEEFIRPVDETRDPELARFITHFSNTKAKVEQRRDNFQCESSQSKQSLTEEELIVNNTDPGVTQEDKTIAAQEIAEVARHIKSQTALVSVSEFLMKGLTELTNRIIELIK